MNSLVHKSMNAIWRALQQSAVFWDVDGVALDRVQHADWIIDRVLQFGQWDDWMAVFSLYSVPQIQDALQHRRVPNHIREFWQAYFNEKVNAVMHPEILYPNTAALWQQHGAALCPEGYLLAGGTALALYLGHRRSDDLDFMTMNAQDPSRLMDYLHQLGPIVTLVDRSEYSLHVLIEGVKLSYLLQPSIRLEVGQILDGIPLASLSTMATLKCHAIANRGSRKDFIDVYALIQKGWSLDQILDHAQDQAPQLNRAHVLRSLTYFMDVDAEPMPRVHRSWAWEEVRRTLAHAVHTYLQHHSPESGSIDP